MMHPGIAEQQPTWGCENSWTRRWKPVNTTHPIPPVQQIDSDQHLSQSATSTPPSALTPTTPSPTPVVDSDRGEDNRRGWSWGERRRRRQESREAEVRAEEALRMASKAAAGAEAKVEPLKTEGEEEMRRLRDVVEGLWADKKLAAANAQKEKSEQVG